MEEKRMFGWFLAAAVIKAFQNGTADSIEDYCNQYGRDYEDAFVRRWVDDDDEVGDDFVCWDDDD